MSMPVFGANLAQGTALLRDERPFRVCHLERLKGPTALFLHRLSTTFWRAYSNAAWASSVPEPWLCREKAGPLLWPTFHRRIIFNPLGLHSGACARDVAHLGWNICGAQASWMLVTTPSLPKGPRLCRFVWSKAFHPTSIARASLLVQRHASVCRYSSWPQASAESGHCGCLPVFRRRSC